MNFFLLLLLFFCPDFYFHYCSILKTIYFIKGLAICSPCISESSRQIFDEYSGAALKTLGISGGSTYPDLQFPALLPNLQF